MRYALLAVALLACARSPKPAEQPASADQPSQAVRTEVMPAAGAASAQGQLPTEVSKPVPPPPHDRETSAAPPPTQADPATPRGNIIGQAWYAGPACGYSNWPPRCNGPYRRAQVTIWSHAQSQWLRNAITDDEGRFRFEVDPGWYTIVLVTGYERSPYWFAKVNVPPLETLTQNLVVDFGQR